MGRMEGRAKVFGVLDDDERDDDTATTAMLTDLDEMDSESEGESDDGEDFAAENAPRPPPETPMYGGNGKSHEGVGECIKPRDGHRNEPPSHSEAGGNVSIRPALAGRVRDIADEHKHGERDIADEHVRSREPGVRDIADEHKRG